MHCVYCGGVVSIETLMLHVSCRNGRDFESADIIKICVNVRDDKNYIPVNDFIIFNSDTLLCMSPLRIIL